MSWKDLHGNRTSSQEVIFEQIKGIIIHHSQQIYSPVPHINYWHENVNRDFSVDKHYFSNTIKAGRSFEMINVLGSKEIMMRKTLPNCMYEIPH